MDNFVRCHEAVQLVCSSIAPSVQKTLDDWHQRNLRNLGICTSQSPQICPTKGKPIARKGFCQSCVDWGQAIENAYFPQSTTVSIKWSNINPTLFCKDPIEVAKVFVLRLPQGYAYSSVDDLDVASLLMLATHFVPYHQGDLSLHGNLEKVSKIRNEVSHMKLKNNMVLDDIQTGQYFDDIKDLLASLSPRYFTPDMVDQMKLDVQQIQTSPVSSRMKGSALRPLTDEHKAMVLELIQEHQDQHRNSQSPPCLDIELCERQLKEHYLQSLCKIPRFPGDSDCLDMNEIYTKLSIHYEMTQPCAPIKIPLTSHHEIFTRKVNCVLPRRILILGRGGSGKSTLLAKIAYDWAMKDEESPLKDLPLLFVLNMRWMRYESDLEDAILHQLLPRDTMITKDSLRCFLQKNPDSAMILLDSYDEFSRGEVLSSNVFKEGSVINTLSNNCFTSCIILVSSRHWRASDFSGLRNIYAKIDVEGFSEIDVKEYIMRYFQDKPNAGERLCDYIKNNNLLSVASVPLMAQLFCLYWMETEEKAIPDKISDLYTDILHILYKHCKAKENSQITLQFDDIVLQLGQCALLGLWPPENRLVFSYEEVKNITSTQCIKDGCKTGIISIEKKGHSYRSRIHDTVDDVKQSIVFYHKSTQEKCAAEYLSHLANNKPSELMHTLQQLDSVKTCLSVQMVLRFACGSSLKAAGCILERLITFAGKELQDDILAKYYDDTMKDAEKVKTVQEFIEMCLLCNYECGSNNFCQMLAILFPTGAMQFLGLSPHVSAAAAHFLSCSRDINLITKISIMQIPLPGIITTIGHSSGAVRTICATVQKNLSSKSSQSHDELRNIYTDYIAGPGHQSTSVFDKFKSMVGSNFGYGLVHIGTWEYFKTWHSAHCSLNINPIIDAVKFTTLNTLDFSYILLKDSGKRLVAAVEQGHLTFLTHLILPETGMSVGNMNRLVGLLPQCTPNLQVLDISNDSAENSQVISSLAKSLPSVPLRVLDISFMFSPASSMTILAQAIPKCCTHLVELRMRGNYMDDETGKALGSTLPCAHHLQVLKMRVDGMSRKIHKRLVMTMGKLTQLRDLRMHYSYYADDLVLYTSRVVTSLNLTVLALGASYSDSHRSQSPWKRLLGTIKKTEHTSEESVPVLSRSSWKSFMSSLQHTAIQIQKLYLMDIRLHKTDLQCLLSLCRARNIKLGPESHVFLPPSYPAMVDLSYGYTAWECLR